MSDEDENSKANVLGRLALEDMPDAANLLAETLSYPVFPLKDTVFKILLKINKLEVYAALLATLSKLPPEKLDEIKKMLVKGELIEELVLKLYEWRRQPYSPEVVASIIAVMGFVGSAAQVKSLATCLNYGNETVKNVIISSMKRIGSPICMECLYEPLKTAAPELAEKMLDLITMFRLSRCIEPLLTIIGSLVPVVQRHVLDMLSVFPSEEVERVIDENLGAATVDLAQGAVIFYESLDRGGSAKQLRERYSLTGSVSALVLQQKEKLAIQVKETGDIALIVLAGIIDERSLPAFKTEVESLITQGHLKVLLFCEKVTKAEVAFLELLDALAAQLEVYSGSCMVIGLNCVDPKLMESYLRKTKIFTDIKQALLSFSREKRERTIRFSEDMVVPGRDVEVEARAGFKKFTRRTNILGYRHKKLIIEWVARGPKDTFDKTLSRAISFTLVHKGSVIKFDADVIEQVFTPVPSIVVARIEMGMVTEQRRHVRAEANMPVHYHHIISSTTIRKDLHGLCKDISAGGMLLSTKEMIPVNDLVLVFFDEGESFKDKKVLGRVVREIQEVGRDEAFNDYGICFMQIQEGIMSGITSFVFESLSKEAGI